MSRKLLTFLGGLALVGIFAAAMAWAFPAQTTSAAEIDAVLTELDTTPLQRDRPNRGDRDNPGQGEMNDKALVAALINETSQLSGLTRQEVVDELATGQTLAQIAQAHGTSADAVVAAMSAKAKERLDKQVENGRISQERADELLSRLQTKANELMNDTTLGEKVNNVKDRVANAKVMPALIRHAAETTGLPVGDITGRLRDGETLTQIVTSAGGDINAVIDAATAEFRTAAENAVK